MTEKRIHTCSEQFNCGCERQLEAATEWTLCHKTQSWCSQTSPQVNHVFPSNTKFSFSSHSKKRWHSYKNQQKIHIMLKHWFFCKDIPIYQQIHKITKHMSQKKKQRLTGKKNSYLVWVGMRFRFGWERGRDWCVARLVAVWERDAADWLGCLFWRWRRYGRAREGYGWRIEDGLTWICYRVSESVDCEARLQGEGVAGEEEESI